MEAPKADAPAEHKRGNVRFADVRIREYDRVVEPGVDGLPRLALGWEAKRETFRRLDSLERERDGVRVPGKQMHPLSARERLAIVQSAKGLLSETLSPRPEDDDAEGHHAGDDSGKMAEVDDDGPVPGAHEQYDAELDLWHMSPEGNVHHTGGITSRVVGVEGRVVITAAHGSRYALKRIKPEIRAVLERIGIPFDAARPLDNVPSLVYAQAVVQLEPLMTEARRLLGTIETGLVPFGPSVVDCFTTMKQAMQAVGFPPAPAL